MNVDQQQALKEVRIALYERLSCYSFTEAMLKPRSIYQLLCLVHMLSGHRNWIGRHTDTAWALEQTFGWDAIHEEPKPEPEKTAVVN